MGGNKVYISDHENVHILENLENQEKEKKEKYYS